MIQDRPCQEAAPFPAGVAPRPCQPGSGSRKGWEAGRARPVVGRLGREGQSQGRPGSAALGGRGGRESPEISPEEPERRWRPGECLVPFLIEL